MCQCSCNKPEIDSTQRAKMDEIINKYKDQTGCLIPILHEIQEFYGYLPYEVQKIVADGTGIPMADVFGVISFYSRFTTEPVGKYKVSVCMGTACYVKSADKVLAHVENMLGVKAGETTEDLMFTVEGTRCVGACGLAPVVIVGEDVYGKVGLGVEETEKIIKKYQQ